MSKKPGKKHQAKRVQTPPSPASLRPRFVRRLSAIHATLGDAIANACEAGLSSAELDGMTKAKAAICRARDRIQDRLS